MNPVQRSRLFAATIYTLAAAQSACLALVLVSRGFAWFVIMASAFGVASVIRFGLWLMAYPDGDS